MSWSIEVDDRAMMRELRRLEDGPDFEHFQIFQATVHAQYIEARLDVHVITGSLYGSAKWQAHDDHLGNTFEGEVTFGGDSPGGVHNPVDYAQIEQARMPGGRYGKPARSWTGEHVAHAGDHDFMRNVPSLEHGYVESILSFFRG